MSFPIAAGEDSTRIKVLKKADVAARGEARRALAAEEELASAARQASAPAEQGTKPPGQPLPHVHGSVAGSGPIVALATPPSPTTVDPKVQLVQVEPGIYDLYFTCSCGEQYVIRCESLEKAAQ